MGLLNLHHDAICKFESRQNIDPLHDFLHYSTEVIYVVPLLARAFDKTGERFSKPAIKYIISTNLLPRSMQAH